MKKAILILVAPLALFLWSCSDSGSEGNNTNDIPAIEGQITSQTDCKDFSTKSKNAEIASTNETCAVWQYSGGNLHIKQVNAGFNCCPAEIVSTFVLEGNTIIITPKETASDCDCNCLYDLEFDLTNVQAQLYTIRFVEQYAGEEDEKLEFEVDFSKQPSGSYCVPRTHYPWGF